MTGNFIRSIVATLMLGTPAAGFAQLLPITPADLAARLAALESPIIIKTTIVGTDIAGTPPVASASETIGNSLIQVNGTDPDRTGYLAFKYGADGKGVVNYWVKTRGAKTNTYNAVQLGDRIVSDYWQAGTGGQTGHVGFTQVSVDNAAFTAGEVAGRWALYTGTGIHVTQATAQYPKRYSSIAALVVNSYQQVLFPGGISATIPRAGSNFGGWVVIGAGAAAPGFGALKFLSSGAALLTAPEPGAFEVDAAARPYFTSADGVRRGIVLADSGIPTVRVLGSAGTGASVAIDAGGMSGKITLVAGTGVGAGDLFTVTYAHPYPAASYPVVSAANAAAVPLVRGGYLTATTTGFTLSLPAGTAVAAGTTYAITFYAPGR